MLEANYSETEIVNYWIEISKALESNLDRILGFASRFEELFKDVEAIHREKGHARSSVGLLKSMSGNVMEGVKRDGW
jgi:hypothetical protein